MDKKITTNRTVFGKIVFLIILEIFVISHSVYGARKRNIPQDPITRAVYDRDLKKLRELVKSGADINHRDSFTGYTPLHHIKLEHDEITDEDIAIAEYLIKNKADVNRINIQYRYTPLHVLSLTEHIQENDLKAIELLLKNKADVNAREERGRTPLHLLLQFCENINIEMIDLYLRYGADVNATDNPDSNILMYAIRFCPLKKRYKIIRFLISKGVNINYLTKYNATVLTFSLGTYARPELRIVKLLIKSGAKTQYSGYSNKPLHIASAWVNDIEIIKLLIASGAKVNSIGNLGNTPLHYAIYRDKPKLDIIQLLLVNGARTDMKNQNKQTVYDLVKKHQGKAKLYKNIIQLLEKYKENNKKKQQRR